MSVFESFVYCLNRTKKDSVQRLVLNNTVWDLIKEHTCFYIFLEFYFIVFKKIEMLRSADLLHVNKLSLLKFKIGQIWVFGLELQPGASCTLEAYKKAVILQVDLCKQ